MMCRRFRFTIRQTNFSQSETSHRNKQYFKGHIQ